MVVGCGVLAFRGLGCLVERFGLNGLYRGYRVIGYTCSGEGFLCLAFLGLGV